ncbi:tetratricopeptide repeat protein [Enterobacter bugandensis]|uniref:tetratricopeptide repeat protein n=1 Tax=Enterobacter bugandensis TaxID=881260 RepID=UPI002360400A|nr:tetratricopeptide repeat protein [Enterobacter bugandensis]
MMNRDAEKQDNDSQIMQKIIEVMALQKLQDVDQKTRGSLYLCAWNLYQQQKLDESETLFRFLCLLDSGHKDHLTGLAAVYQLKKKYRRAIDLYRAAHQLAPDELRPVLQAGYCYLLMKKNAKARACFEEVCATSKDPQLKLAAQNYLDVLDRMTSETKEKKEIK